jgi:hypothetical protein
MAELPSLFIVGCGRNGTSACAGLFRQSGLFMGDRLYLPSDANPLGFFEDAGINRLNNGILSNYVPTDPEIYQGIKYQHDSPGRAHAWLARISPNTEIAAEASQLAEIERWTARAPFCYKDPRFCYLLHLWRRTALNAKMLCVFRAPVIAAKSILHVCQTHPPLADFAISVNQAFELWMLSYQHVLQRQANEGEWFFVEYDDLLNGRALDALERFAEHPIDRSFLEPTHNRSSASFKTPADVSRTYALLKERAAACY